MTTSTLPPIKPLRSRLGSVIKLHFANPWTSISFPWIILGIIFLANLAIWTLIFMSTPPEDHAGIAAGLQWSGASLFIFVYMMVVAIQSINITFGFALGYGVTRRDYYIGTSIQFLLLAAIFTAGLTVMSVIEELTGGWGMGGQMFTAAYFGDGPWYERAFAYFTLFAFFLFIGAAFGAVYVRWKATGITLFFVALTAILIAALFLIIATDSWPIVGNFFAGAGLLGTYAWSLVLTAIAAVSGFLLLRRATPRSA